MIFNILEEVVIDAFGDDVWDALLDRARLDGAYTSLGSYPDRDLLALVAAAADVTGKSEADILIWFGRQALPHLARRYPGFFQDQSGARNFILSVNSIIHPEVRKLYSGAGCPHFLFTDGAAGELLVGYQSERKLCTLAQGFIEGAADHYGETVAVEHRTCMQHGASSCQLSVTWTV